MENHNFFLIGCIIKNFLIMIFFFEIYSRKDDLRKFSTYRSCITKKKRVVKGRGGDEGVSASRFEGLKIISWRILFGEIALASILLKKNLVWIYY